MNRFLLKLIIFITPILLLMVGLEIALRNLPNDYKLKWSSLTQKEAELEVLVFGSSHAFYGVNPYYLSANAYNMSYVTQTINQELSIFSEKKEKLKNLKRIYWLISSFSLGSDLESLNSVSRYKNYVLYYGSKGTRLEHYSELLSYNLKSSIGRLKSYYYDHNFSYSCDSLGFSGRNKIMELEKTAKDAAKRHRVDFQDEEVIKLIKKQLLGLNEVLDFCEENEIEVVFLIPPFTSYYVDAVGEHQWNELDRRMKKLTKGRKYCTYYNLMNAKEFEDSDFYDGDHLNEQGAEKLSKLLVEKTKK